MEVLTHRPEGSRRATTLIKAKYNVGDFEKVKIINLAQLKKDNPNPVAEPPSVPGVPPAHTLPQNLEQSSTNSVASPPTTATTTGTAAIAPGTSQT